MIEAQHLCRRYRDLLAVDDVSFRIGRGEIVGLLGHNGAGKTTVMKMITGYLEPTAGRVRVDGEAVRPESAASRARLSRRIGHLPENCPMWPEMTVLEYLDYQAALHGVPGVRAVQAVQEAARPGTPATYRAMADTAVAPLLAQALALAGLALHALQPERQDLEAVFARVNEDTPTAAPAASAGASSEEVPAIKEMARA